MRIDITTVIAELASRRHGVVTREELLAAGVSPAAIDRAVRAGRLERRHPGIYVVVGAPELWRARVLADVCYVHRQARRLDQDARRLVVATGTTAAFLHDLPFVERPDTTVLATSELSRSRAVLHLHRPELLDTDVVVVGEVPCTSLDWTANEVAAVLPDRVLENGIAALLRSRRTSVGELLATGARMESSAGPPILRELLESMSEDDLRARSGTERRGQRGMVARGYPAPAINARVRVRAGGAVVVAPELDFWWAELLLDVEFDGPHHELPEQQRRDRERDRRLERAGVWVERIPVTDVDADLEGVLDRVGELIAMRTRHVADDHSHCPPDCGPAAASTDLAAQPAGADG